MRLQIIRAAVLFSAAFAVPVSAQEAIINACASMAENALRTFAQSSSESAFLAVTYDEHCEVSTSYDSLNSSKKSSFNAVYKQVNRLGYGSDNQNASVSETYDAFCKYEANTFASNRSDYRDLSTIHQDALRVVELCLESQAAGVEVAYQQPASPEDNLAIVFSMRGSGAQFLNGVTVREAICSVGGEELDPLLEPPLRITSESFTVTCERESTPITIYGLDGEHFPRAQITFDTNYSSSPLDIILPEAVVGPLQDRLTAIEEALMPRGGVVAFDRQSGCPTGWTEFAEAAGRTIIGSSEKYPVGATGGEETHTLTVGEMPSHNHGGRTAAGGTSMHYDGSGGAGGFESGGHRFSQGAHRHTISSDGGGTPHNNMQPYVSLVYCHY